MTNKNIFGWFTLDMLVFLALNVFLIWHFSDKLSGISSIGFFRFMILGLAIYRAANIVSNERVTKPLRAPFVDEKELAGKIVEQPKKKGFLGAMGFLIYCPSCTGVWLAAIFIYSYIFWPIATLVIALFLALSAIERIIALVLAGLKS